MEGHNDQPKCSHAGKFSKISHADGVGLILPLDFGKNKECFDGSGGMMKSYSMNSIATRINFANPR